MLVLKLLAAVFFILSSGSLFSARFRKNRLLLAGAAIVVLTSGYYLSVAIWTDLKQFGDKLDSVEEGIDVLPPLPEEKPPRQSGLAYVVELTQGAARFVFPKEAIDELLRIAPGGDLSGAMFQATIDDRIDVVCQHFVPNSAGTCELIREMDALLTALSCDLWRGRETGTDHVLC